MTNENNKELQSKKWYRLFQVFRFACYTSGLVVIIAIFLFTVPNKVLDTDKSYINYNCDVGTESGLSLFERQILANGSNMPLSDFGILSNELDTSALNDSGYVLSSSAMEKINKKCHTNIGAGVMNTYVNIATIEQPSSTFRFSLIAGLIISLVVVLEGLRLAIIYIMTGKFNSK